MTTFQQVWQVPDADVVSGRIPGYVGAVRIGGVTEFHAGGRRAVEPDSPPMAEDTLFRIASLTKPMGGALALSLVEDGVLALDDPIARWLPEAASPRVLSAPDAELGDTVAARRAITLRDLLAGTSGWGAVLADSPLQRAMLQQGLFPGPIPQQLTPDEYIARVAALPLAFQPGEGWLYDSGVDVAGVLLARAAGLSLPELVAERITRPLGMADTAFWTPHVERLATAYRPAGDGLEVLDPPDGVFSRPPLFPTLSGGLVSTAADVLRFFTAMADGGAPVVTADAVALMTTDALTDEQRGQALPLVDEGGSWGLATAVDIEAAEPWMAPGRWGWDGGTGTTARVDPTRGTVGVLLTQRAMTGPLDGFGAFWTAVSEAA